MGKVLLVEDEDILRNSLAQLLKKKGHEVSEAQDEQGAIELLKTDCFNLVVADIFLESGNGLGLMSYISNNCPKVKCIAITGHASLDSAIHALRKGVTDYLLKPFSYDDFIDSVDNALRLQEEEDKAGGINLDGFAKSYSLTKKERHIVNILVTHGFSNEDLAASMKVSVNTIKVHLRNIFRKVDVESKTALVSKLLTMK